MGAGHRYIAEKVHAPPPTQRLDAFLAPYYGWIIERLTGAIRPDVDAGEAPEVPDIDHDRPCATADISVFTAKEVREVLRSHVNLIVSDSFWEQSAGYFLDKHPAVAAFVKNHGLNFAIPYLHNGQPKEYLPDFVVRLVGDGDRNLICEIKGADWEGTTEIKAQAAHRWCAAINATGEYGHWDYHLAFSVAALVTHLDGLAPVGAAAAR
jgi:type III restriction enzyme